MSFASLTLVVLAAFIHATWNLLSKRAAAAGPAFVLAYNLVAIVAYPPWVTWLLTHGAMTWSLPVAGCMLLSGLLHLAYSLCLQRGYQVADLSVVYPVARGTGPMLSSLGAFLLLGEMPSLQRCARPVGGRRRHRPHLDARQSLRRSVAPRPFGLRWGAATGAFTPSYTIVVRLRGQGLGIQPVSRLVLEPAALRAARAVVLRNPWPCARADEGPVAARGGRGRAVASLLHPRACGVGHRSPGERGRAGARNVDDGRCPVRDGHPAPTAAGPKCRHDGLGIRGCRAQRHDAAPSSR